MHKAVQVRGRTKAAPEKLDHLRVHGAEDGGRIVAHHFDSGAKVQGANAAVSQFQGASDEYHFAPHEGNELIAHLKEHLGIGEDGQIDHSGLQSDEEDSEQES